MKFLAHSSAISAVRGGRAWWKVRKPVETREMCVSNHTLRPDHLLNPSVVGANICPPCSLPIHSKCDVKFRVPSNEYQLSRENVCKTLGRSKIRSGHSDVTNSGVLPESDFPLAKLAVKAQFKT